MSNVEIVQIESDIALSKISSIFLRTPRGGTTTGAYLTENDRSFFQVLKDNPIIPSREVRVFVRETIAVEQDVHERSDVVSSEIENHSEHHRRVSETARQSRKARYKNPPSFGHDQAFFDTRDRRQSRSDVHYAGRRDPSSKRRANRFLSVERSGSACRSCLGRTTATHLHDAELFEPESLEEEVTHFSNIALFVEIRDQEDDRVIL